MKIVYFIFMLLFLTGCATASKLNQLSLGMTKQKAIEIMGSPITIHAQNNIEILEYRLWPTIYNNYKEKYLIRIVNSKVEKFGHVSIFSSNEPENVNILQIQTNTFLTDANYP